MPLLQMPSIYDACLNVTCTPGGGGGGGGGHSGTEGGRTLVTYFAEEEVFFEDLSMSAIL